MLKSILNLSGARSLSAADQQAVSGGGLSAQTCGDQTCATLNCLPSESCVQVFCPIPGPYAGNYTYACTPDLGNK